MNSKKKAFTLVEMIVATGLVGIISVIVSGIYSNGIKQYSLGIKRIGLNESVAFATRDFEKMTRGATKIITAENNSLTFLSYLRADAHPAPSKISFYIQEGVLYRSNIAPVSSEGSFIYPESDKVVKKITENLLDDNIFSYFNDANTDLSFPIQNDVVRMIKISIGIDDDKNSPPESAVQSTAVQLRNLKNNL